MNSTSQLARCAVAARWLLVLAALATGASPAAAQARCVWYGDSQTFDGGIVLGVAGVHYPWIVSTIRGCSTLVYAVAGSVTTDQVPAVYAYAPQAGDRISRMFGTNDFRYWPITTSSAAAMWSGMTAEQVRWLSSTHLTGKDAGVTYTGTWSSSTSSPGKYTAQSGATATMSFSGDVFFWGYQTYDGTAASVAVVIDGASKGTFALAPPSPFRVLPLDPAYVKPYWGPQSLRIAGCGSGSHTAVLTFTVPSGSLAWNDWIATGVAIRRVDLLTAPRLPSSFGADAQIAAGNALLGPIAAQAVADGHDVHVIDVGAAIDPAVDTIAADGHLTGEAHWKAARAILAAP